MQNPDIEREYRQPPEEYPAPAPQFTPPPQEFGSGGSSAPSRNRKRFMRHLLIAALAAGAISLAGLFGDTAEAASLFAPAPAQTAGAAVAAIVSASTSAPDSTPIPPTLSPTPASTPTPTPTPTPPPSPTPTPKFSLENISGTYQVEGSGQSSSTRYYFISTGTQSVSLSGTVTIATAGDNALSMDVSIGHGFDTTGEGAYTCDESSGTAHLVDSLGFDVTLRFTEENGQILLEMVKVYVIEDGATLTITLSGPKAD